MSSSSEISAAKSPEKSTTFSQTCNLLSQYLKEKGSFGDLTLGMERNVQGSPVTTMELFPMATQNLKSMNLFYPPQQSEVPTLVKSSAMGNEPKAAQLTMFYEGQVIVFDDFPAEKVKEIMAYASKGVSQSQNNNNSAYACNQNQPSIRPIVHDLPIARKVSLHRFLEKRKDRISSKAPYQISAPEKPVESISWLGLGATPTQI
ncbi:protein TIFY 10A-like [Lotus japonicus]|uniref:protein TIFY 10A-like n=1 Tax=Lotus japonicus TaxID=34305 RepID=UPI00258F9190|nr:protein TIFY 10A-like [Lotus japonicus]